MNCIVCNWIIPKRKKERKITYSKTDQGVLVGDCCNSCDFIKERNGLKTGQEVQRLVNDSYIIRRYVK